MKRFREQRASRLPVGSAMTETLIALLAFAPFVAAIPLLGKQTDIKQKTFDAARYSVWERVVWRSSGTANRKSEEQLTLEARDRVLGDPRTGMRAGDVLANLGITENPLWRDGARERLIDYEQERSGVDMDFDEAQAPVEVGYFIVPGVAYGEGAIAAIANALQVEDLNLSRRSFASATLALAVRPTLVDAARVRRTLGEKTSARDNARALIQSASSAILSDTWSAADEDDFRRRVDRLTTDELLENLELPARAIGSMALGKGELLYGEGQFAWDPDLQPNSTTLPRAYVREE
jgi:hypothetical protein